MARRVEADGRATATMAEDRVPRPEGAGLDRLLGRIGALREKTVARGCTEAEALAAAAKVAALLDRYGLSLSETELKRQPCERFGLDTGRRRRTPADGCIPAVAAFFDCQAWSERTGEGELRHVFFGLPADVAGARYLQALVENAFATETRRFKRSPLYTVHDTAGRRRASRSFQAGLAQGIARKLQALRAERDVAMRAATGRSLVPLKESVVAAELAKLGLRFVPGSARTVRVLAAAYRAGHEAGERFAYRPGLEGG
jgi:hypothetical protein